MTPPPKRFTGDDPAVDSLNRMLQNDLERTPLSSEDIIVEPTGKGFRLKLRNPQPPAADSLPVWLP